MRVKYSGVSTVFSGYQDLQRADQFFAFDDFNNAERIYREVMEFEKGK